MITEYPYHKLVERMHKIYKELVLKNHDQDLTPLEANILDEVASGLADVTKHNILMDEVNKDTVIQMSDWQRSNLQKSATAIEFGISKILEIPCKS